MSSIFSFGGIVSYGGTYHQLAILLVRTLHTPVGVETAPCPDVDVRLKDHTRFSLILYTIVGCRLSIRLYLARHMQQWISQSRP